MIVLKIIFSSINRYNLIIVYGIFSLFETSLSPNNYILEIIQREIYILNSNKPPNKPKKNLFF